MAAPNLRWFQFRLRTLFVVVTMAGLLTAWVKSSLDQIAERKAFTAEVNARFAVPGSVYVTYQPIAPPTWGNILRLMWILGEERQPTAQLALEDPADDAERDRNWELIQRARRLFPESTIIANFHEPR